MYRQSEKNLLSTNTSSTYPDNMVNFGPLTAEICWQVWGTPPHFSWFRVLAALLHSTLVVGPTLGIEYGKAFTFTFYTSVQLVQDTADCVFRVARKQLDV